MKILKGGANAKQCLIGEMLNLEAGKRLYENGEKVVGEPKPYPVLEIDAGEAHFRSRVGFIYVVGEAKNEKRNRAQKLTEALKSYPITGARQIAANHGVFTAEYREPPASRYIMQYDEDERLLVNIRRHAFVWAIVECPTITTFRNHFDNLMHKHDTHGKYIPLMRYAYSILYDKYDYIDVADGAVVYTPISAKNIPICDKIVYTEKCGDIYKYNSINVRLHIPKAMATKPRPATTAELESIALHYMQYTISHNNYHAMDEAPIIADKQPKNCESCSIPIYDWAFVSVNAVLPSVESVLDGAKNKPTKVTAKFFCRQCRDDHNGWILRYVKPVSRTLLSALLESLAAQPICDVIQAIASGEYEIDNTWIVLTLNGVQHLGIPSDITDHLTLSKRLSAYNKKDVRVFHYIPNQHNKQKA